MKKAFFALIVGGLTFTSCSEENDPVNVDPSLEVPETYFFSRNGESTVYYGGQTTRLEMVGEILSAFNNFENTTEESLSNMFSNENDPFADADLNASSKSVKSKVAASQLYFSANTVESGEIKSDFENFISDQVNEVFPNEEVLAEPGVAGQIADGDRVRYVNAQGLELNQAFAKGLIGGLLLDQITNNYLAAAVLDEAGNRELNDEGVVEEGEVYTTMEHKWDEAYGYLYGDPSIPTADPNSVLGESEDHLLFNYLGSVNSDPDFAGIAEEVFEAFKTGRAAIVAGDYDLRDEQVEIIRENLSKVIAVRAIHYLQAGKEAIENENYGRAFHQLSEGYGFLYSLRFTHKPETGEPYLSPADLEEYKEQLLEGNGFWDVTPETLQTISENIAAEFDFTVEAAAE